jgi:hypothetical protein
MSNSALTTQRTGPVHGGGEFDGIPVEQVTGLVGQELNALRHYHSPGARAEVVSGPRRPSSRGPARVKQKRQSGAWK